MLANSEIVEVHMLHHLGFCIFVMFSTFRDEIQYIFLEKIFMVFLAFKNAGTDVISGNAHTKMLFKHLKMSFKKDATFLKENIYKNHKYAESEKAVCTL